VPATAQFVYQAHSMDKPEVVARILQAQDRDRAMIFSRTKRAAQRLTDDLVERGFAAASIHGDLNQVAREKALKRFREGKVDVLVATDVAARGIDVTGVTHVINYECPDDDKTYVHRIGRTGRAGATGIAITFVDWADQTRWKVINNTLGLPFETPEETYSTSAHLFHDLAIDPNVTGRLVPPSETPERERPARDFAGRDKPNRDRGRGRSSEADQTEKAEKAGGGEGRKKRSRQRLRNGVPVEAGANGEETSPAVPVTDAPVVSAPATEDAPSSSSEHGEGDAPKRRRRRRGGRSRTSSDATASA
jgi:superfamily II DNA/RNA helicase